MFRVPSKYSESHYIPIKKWVRKRATSIWHAAPNAFVKPFISERNFAFVAGCGHSGTTLVAARLGAHSRTLLLGRETAAFSPMVGSYCSRRVVTEWDYFAQLTGSDLVVEKTPKHVHSVHKIRRVLPDAKIVLTTRNPLDNVASLYERFGDLDSAIRRWLVDNKAVLSHLDSNFVKLVRYEDLTANPKDELRETCEFAGLEWESELLVGDTSGYDLTAQDGNMAIRANQVKKPITRNVGRWKDVFSDDAAEVIARKTASLAKDLGYNEVMRIT